MAVCTFAFDDFRTLRSPDGGGGWGRGGADAGQPLALGGSMGDSVTPHSLITGPGKYRFLLGGIDTLDLGIYVDWGGALSDLHSQLEALRILAIHGEPAIWRHPVVGEAVVMPNSKRNYRWHLQFAKLHLWLANTSETDDFPNVYVSPSAQLLWTEGVMGCMSNVRNLITGIGGKIKQILVSRVDWAVDFAIPEGLSLDFLRHALVTRARKTSHHEGGNCLETFYVGKRSSSIQARIYNKALQIMNKPQSAFFLALWGGPLPVWRVEFQLRRASLRELGIDSIDDLILAGHGIWAYLTGDWMSLRLNDSSNTQRRTVHPWWGAVQGCAEELGPESFASRSVGKVPGVPPDWYVAHMSGCLVSFAGQLGLDTIDDALGEFAIKSREYWAGKCWDDAYTRRRIQVGRVEEVDDDDVPI